MGLTYCYKTTVFFNIYYNLSTGATTSDLQWHLTHIAGNESHYSTLNISETVRDKDMHNGIRIGTYTCSRQGCRIQWLWMM